MGPPGRRTSRRPETRHMDAVREDVMFAGVREEEHEGQQRWTRMTFDSWRQNSSSRNCAWDMTLPRVWSITIIEHGKSTVQNIRAAQCFINIKKKISISFSNL